ncbi:OLC1v1035185C1 [Oldenlandia corymbosa var. corymbosa]|uniref:OLC1v1035185C1 n=1 Tax=Oldenlandia corymbosa var. corymbosa TaxID=529605 RepID=A0AAV1CU51_OLDCO|nr:OLC1v1035185C1 [Oldenlandia corymbosa var. corymbosa]
MSGLTAKEKNDTLVDVQDNSNLVSNCLVVKAVPKPGKDADKESPLPKLKQIFDPTNADLRKKAAIDEIQMKDNNSGEQQQLVVFESILHENAIMESASEHMRKECNPDKGLLADVEACMPEKVDAKKQRIIENMENF